MPVHVQLDTWSYISPHSTSNAVRDLSIPKAYDSPGWPEIPTELIYQMYVLCRPPPCMVPPIPMHWYTQMELQYVLVEPATGRTWTDVHDITLTVEIPCRLSGTVIQYSHSNPNSIILDGARQPLIFSFWLCLNQLDLNITIEMFG